MLAVKESDDKRRDTKRENTTANASIEVEDTFVHMCTPHLLRTSLSIYVLVILAMVDRVSWMLRDVPRPGKLYACSAHLSRIPAIIVGWLLVRIDPAAEKEHMCAL